MDREHAQQEAEEDTIDGVAFADFIADLTELEQAADLAAVPEPDDQPFPDNWGEDDSFYGAIPLLLSDPWDRIGDSSTTLSVGHGVDAYDQQHNFDLETHFDPAPTHDVLADLAASCPFTFQAGQDRSDLVSGPTLPAAGCNFPSDAIHTPVSIPHLVAPNLPIFSEPSTAALPPPPPEVLEFPMDLAVYDTEPSTLSLQNDIFYPLALPGQQVPMPATAATQRIRRGTSSKKRKMFDEATRHKVKRVRDMGACIRCRVYHESCDDNEPCQRCKSVEFSATIRQPCSRETLDKIVVFRAGNSRVNQVRSKLPVLRWTAADVASRIVCLAYPFAASQHPTPALDLICRRFIPGKTDVLKDVWSGEDGAELVLEFPPFACYDTIAARTGLGKYIQDCEELFDRKLQSETTDILSSLTMQEASRFASIHPDSSVKDALNLRRVACFCRESMTIIGNETLGIAKVDDKRFFIHDQIPVPSVLDFQIDTLAIELMLQILKRIVRRLKDTIFGKRSKDNWYEIYLTCFILLNCLSTAYALQLSYMDWNKNMEGNTYANVSYITRTMIEEWEYSANNLLVHFRCVLKGMIPFTLLWDRPLDEIEGAATAGLDVGAISYM